MPIDTMLHKTHQTIYYSYDARSEYPYIMICKKYPMTGFTLLTDKIKSTADWQKIRDKGYALLFKAHFEGLKCRDHITVPYIPFSKAKIQGDFTLDNGRVLDAEYLSMTLTEIDYDIIIKQYSRNKIAITDVYCSEYDYLPEPIVNHVRDGFYEKCGYEERKEKGTYYYDRCKNRVNGNFGMMYTDPVRDEVIIYDKLTDNNKRWGNNRPDIQTALDKFYNSRNSFLCYQWGVWTTAHARAHHQKLIDAFGPEFIYGDTDSAKGTDVQGHVSETIKTINSAIEKECIPRKAYYDMADGRRLYMGVFVQEEKMKAFRTLGAKKYAYVTEDNKLHVTISGVVRETADGFTSSEELGLIEDFRPGKKFIQCGGLECRYHDIDAPITQTFIDAEGKKHIVTYGSNVSMIDSTYTLGVGNDYGLLLNFLKNDS